MKPLISPEAVPKPQIQEHPNPWARRVVQALLFCLFAIAIILNPAKKAAGEKPAPATITTQVTATTRNTTSTTLEKVSTTVNRPRAQVTVPQDTTTKPPEVVNLTGNRELGRFMMLETGWWGEDQWPCLDELWGPLESGWNHTADNPHSSAYGIPQALPGNKMGPGWESDPIVQIRWGLGYIKDRYGSPCAAKNFRVANGWY